MPVASPSQRNISNNNDTANAHVLADIKLNPSLGGFYRDAFVTDRNQPEVRIDEPVMNINNEVFQQNADDNDNNDDGEEEKYRIDNSKIGYWDKSLFIMGTKREKQENEDYLKKCIAVPNCPYVESQTSSNMKRHTRNVHGQGVKPKYLGIYVNKDESEKLKSRSKAAMYLDKKRFNEASKNEVYCGSQNIIDCQGEGIELQYSGTYVKKDAYKNLKENCVTNINELKIERARARAIELRAAKDRESLRS